MISKRGNRWRVVVQGGRDPFTGKRRQLSGSAATKTEALQLERHLMAQSVGAPQSAATLTAVVDEWWASPLRLAPTTRLNYRSNLNLHILPTLGSTKVADIRPRLVASFLRHLQLDRGLSAATVRKVRTVLSAVMSYAVAMEYIDSNPVMKVPPPELDAAERVAPTLEETARLLLGAERTDPEFLTYLWVAAEEGGRRGETLALRWGGVDFETGTLTIDSTVSRGEDGVKVRPRTKTRKPRRIAISATTLQHLAEHRRRHEDLLRDVGYLPQVHGDALVFSGGRGSRRHPLDGKPWRPDSTTRRFARVKRAAGVRADIDLHGLRHTMVTELLAAGVDPRTVMGRAGHSCSATSLIPPSLRPRARRHSPTSRTACSRISAGYFRTAAMDHILRHSDRGSTEPGAIQRADDACVCSDWVNRPSSLLRAPTGRAISKRARGSDDECAGAQPSDSQDHRQCDEGDSKSAAGEDRCNCAPDDEEREERG